MTKEINVNGVPLTVWNNYQRLVSLEQRLKIEIQKLDDYIKTYDPVMGLEFLRDCKLLQTEFNKILRGDKN